MKVAARAFLSGASSRLLPASIPFRFFGAAIVYHLLAWIALGFNAQSVPRFVGGLGWPLAVLHLVTLGVLTMAAMGASLQLLPVATRQPVLSTRWPAAIWWLYTPGVGALTLGMGLISPGLLAAGAVAVVAALAGYALLLARNLIGARGMPVVVAHVWAALASLIVVLVSASSLAGAYAGFGGFVRPAALAWHVASAAYGFMGFLALGFSYILVPMFALSAPPNERLAGLSFSLAVLALLLVAASGVAPAPLGVAAIGTGACAVALHLWMMNAVLRTGMRRQLGRALSLARIAWAMLIASLVVALGVVLDSPFDGTVTLFGVLLIGGWLLTFLLGILQRIMPFLASMHVAPGRHRPPTPSSLTAERPLSIHFVCHLAALTLLGIAVLVDSGWAAFAGAVVGMTGAAAFGRFFITLVWRMAGLGRVDGRGQASAR